jgi:hypothetical protein
MERFPAVRQSLLAAFDRCALATVMGLEYEEGWSTHEQARGQVLHRALAKCLAEMYERREKTIPADVATAILLECLRQADVDPRDVVNLPIEQVKDMRWTIVKWANESSLDVEALVDVEQRLNATLRYPDPEGGTVERVVTGQLDALFIFGAEADRATVLDWKDTWSLPAPTEVSFDGYFQQRMYAFLVMRNFPSVHSVTLREVYVRRSEPREATVWRSDLENIEAELSALVERFDRAVERGKAPWSDEARALHNARRAETDPVRRRELRVAHENLIGPWSPSPGAHCSWCPRPTACPIFPTARNAGRIVSQVDAERVAAETIVADAAAKKGKEALKVWADRHGPIPIKDAKGERVWGHRAYTRTAAPSPDDVQAEVELARLERRPPDVRRLWRSSTASRFEPHTPRPASGEDAEADAALLEAMERSVRQAREDAA